MRLDLPRGARAVALHDGVVYFANSGGLVQGWDVSGLDGGATPTRVFRFWTGDDTDASVVVDDDGFLYVAVENERGNARAAEAGGVAEAAEATTAASG